MNRRSSQAFAGPPMFRLGKGEATLVKVMDLRRLVAAARRARRSIEDVPPYLGEPLHDAMTGLDRALDPFLSIE